MDIAHLHFLVAEAHAGARTAICEVLAQVGATHITQVSDGHTALRCFHDTYSPPIEIAIIDIALAGMDGLELLRSLAAMNSRARVIMIGALPNNLLFSIETMAQAYGIELLGTLAKPVKAQPLTGLIRHFVPPAAPSGNRKAGPTFTFSEVGAGLQARQFEPYFQPKIALETGHVKGLEVYARWVHPSMANSVRAPSLTRSSKTTASIFSTGA